ncbi:MAG: fibronectin type III domain-containing protein [Pseudomonadota bacterium]
MTLPLDITQYFAGSSLSYAANGLPAGLSLNGSTGLITGNPTTPGVSLVTITASNSAGSAQQNFQWTITSGASAPAQVTGLVASPGDGEVSLSWDEPDNNGSALTDYVLERREDGGAFSVLSDGLGAGRSFVDNGVTNGIEYGYRVSAVNGEGTGPVSAIATVTPVATATAPGQVTGLTAVAGDAQVSLSWSAPGDGGSALTDYILEVDTGAGFSVINDGVGTATSFDHTGLANGIQHTYRVAAVNAVGTGAASVTANATPETASSSVAIVARDAAGDGASRSVYTFPGIAMGTGDVFIGVTFRGGGGNEVTSVTLDGTPVTLVSSSGKVQNQQEISIWRIDGQTAGTGEVVVTMAANTSRCGIGVWSVAGAGVVETVFDISPAADVVDGTVNAVADGVLLAYASAIDAVNDPPAFTFTNVTPVDLGGGLLVEELGTNESYFHGLADRETTASQAETVTMSTPADSSLQMLALVAISPS